MGGGLGGRALLESSEGESGVASCSVAGIASSGIASRSGPARRRAQQNRNRTHSLKRFEFSSDDSDK